MKKGKSKKGQKGSMAEQLQDLAPQEEQKVEAQASEVEVESARSDETEVQPDSPPGADVTSTDASDTTDATAENTDTVQATLSAPESDDAAAESDEESEKYDVSLPKEKCFVCRHLLVGMPDALPAGNKMKRVRSAEFSCYTEPGCPAQHIRILHDPFTRTMIENAVLSYWTDGDRSLWNDLDKQADNTSVEVRKKYHRTVKEVVSLFAQQ